MKKEKLKALIEQGVKYELERQAKSKREKQMIAYNLAVSFNKCHLARGHMTAEEFLNKTRIKDYVDND